MRIGFVLHGAEGDFLFGVYGFKHALNLAEFGGWQPAGSVPPENCSSTTLEFWDGGYLHCGSHVSAIDAEAMAAGLRAVLDDIPDIDVSLSENGITPEGGESSREVFAVLKEQYMRAIGGPPIVEPVGQSIEFFSGPENKLKLVEFIRFCEAGGFEIGGEGQK